MIRNVVETCVEQGIVLLSLCVRLKPDFNCEKKDNSDMKINGRLSLSILVSHFLFTVFPIG